MGPSQICWCASWEPWVSEIAQMLTAHTHRIPQLETKNIKKPAPTRVVLSDNPITPFSMTGSVGLRVSFTAQEHAVRWIESRCQRPARSTHRDLWNRWALWLGKWTCEMITMYHYPLYSYFPPLFLIGIWGPEDIEHLIHKRILSDPFGCACFFSFFLQPLKLLSRSNRIFSSRNHPRITGVFLKDDVCIGNLCANMNFIGASHETAEPFGSFDFDGVLGLALSGMTQGPHFSIMDRMEAGCCRRYLMVMVLEPPELPKPKPNRGFKPAKCNVVQSRSWLGVWDKDMAQFLPPLQAAGNLKHPIFAVFLSDSDSEDSEITFGDIKQERMVGDMWLDPKGKAVPDSPSSGL